MLPAGSVATLEPMVTESVPPSGGRMWLRGNGPVMRWDYPAGIESYSRPTTNRTKEMFSGSLSAATAITLRCGPLAQPDAAHESAVTPAGVRLMMSAPPVREERRGLLRHFLFLAGNHSPSLRSCRVPYRSVRRSQRGPQLHRCHLGLRHGTRRLDLAKRTAHRTKEHRSFAGKLIRSAARHGCRYASGDNNRTLIRLWAVGVAPALPGL
jgi:hypothetical protein